MKQHSYHLFLAFIILASTIFGLSPAQGDTDIDDLIKEVKAEMSKKQAYRENSPPLSATADATSPFLLKTL